MSTKSLFFKIRFGGGGGGLGLQPDRPLGCPLGSSRVHRIVCFLLAEPYLSYISYLFRDLEWGIAVEYDVPSFSRLYTAWNLFYFIYLFCGAATQRWSWPHSWGFLDHTQRRTTFGRTPLDEWSARRRDLCLTTHNTHNRQTSMTPVGFEPTISAGERPQTYALDRAATGTGTLYEILSLNFTKYC